MTTIPPTTPEGNEGLRRSSTGIWQAKFEVDGRDRTRSTGERELPAARIARDRIYAELAAAGAATVYGKAERTRLRVLANPGDTWTYINRRLPFTVSIGGRFVGAFETREEARAARNADLLQNDQADPRRDES